MSRISKKLGDLVHRSTSSKSENAVFAEKAESCSTAVELIKRQLENELVTRLADVTGNVRETAPKIATSAEDLRSSGKDIETARLMAVESKEVLQGALVSGGPALDDLNQIAGDLASLLAQKLGGFQKDEE
ncbi:hypothetical protein BSKO_00194 [Bryopsis sp. KO-2023]|nr:hypothetical protein BSKO_00194 [Bryopsis sp. KO-2023]